MTSTKEENLWVSSETALNVLKSVSVELTYHWADGIYLSPAEIFGSLFSFWMPIISPGVPTTIPIQRPIGPTEDCNSESPITVNAEAFLNVASQVHQTVHSAHRVPSVIHLGNAQVTPGSFLKAASEFIRALHAHPEPPQTVMIKSAQTRRRSQNGRILSRCESAVGSWHPTLRQITLLRWQNARLGQQNQQWQ